jgi:hypothetical protein
MREEMRFTTYGATTPNLWWRSQKGMRRFYDLLLELSDNGGDDETKNLLKKRKTEQTQAQRLEKQRVKREATPSQERATGSLRASPPIIVAT